MSYIDLKRKDVKARKRHTCDWCGGHIEKCETYHYNAFIFDGDFCDWHSHLACNRIIHAIWDYVDPGAEGIDGTDFSEGCADVCRQFICPDCEHWNKDDEDCEKGELYCIDRMDEFFKTHELYRTREGYYEKWRCREKEVSDGSDQHRDAKKV